MPHGLVVARAVDARARSRRIRRQPFRAEPFAHGEVGGLPGRECRHRCEREPRSGDSVLHRRRRAAGGSTDRGRPPAPKRVWTPERHGGTLRFVRGGRSAVGPGVRGDEGLVVAATTSPSCASASVLLVLARSFESRDSTRSRPLGWHRSRHFPALFPGSRRRAGSAALARRQEGHRRGGGPCSGGILWRWGAGAATSPSTPRKTWRTPRCTGVRADPPATAPDVRVSIAPIRSRCHPVRVRPSQRSPTDVLFGT